MGLMIYKKKLDYSYTFGIFPTLELLITFPEKVITVLLSPKTDDSEGVAEIKRLCNKHEINFDYSPKAISKLAKKDNTYAIGVFKKYTMALEPDKSHVLLENPSDRGNVGTIMRTMLGFDVTNMAIIRPSVDVFDPGVIRASMGSFFKMNFEYFDSFLHYKQRFNTHTLYPFVLNGKKSLSQVKFERPATLIFGNEGEGLDKSFEKMENTVRIEHSDNVDSLNLSIAASLGLFSYYNN